jgi:hypothetical protein
LPSSLDYQHDWRQANTALALALGFLLPNGCLQQIAANRFSIPQDVIAILLQGFVRASLFAFQLRTTPRRAARCREWILPARLRRPIRGQGRSRDCAIHPALEPLNDSRQPHRSRPRNSLPRDDAPPRTRQEPQSRQRDSMLLSARRCLCSLTTSRDGHAPIVAPATRLTTRSLDVESTTDVAGLKSRQPRSKHASCSVACRRTMRSLDVEQPARFIGLKARQSTLKHGIHAGRGDPSHCRTIWRRDDHAWRYATPALALALASIALTAAFSRSQPIDSQLRRTSSRFCCKALFAVFCVSLMIGAGGESPWRHAMLSVQS